ncbi:rhodanese-like domain-containing protein [Mycolicibacterium grossiae]|uniref:rhodanese-like domain-containing protein n=1 Tax=Mycolicibacterium grossiae TaxID=1552759 RepID=UPI002E1DFAF9
MKGKQFEEFAAGWSDGRLVIDVRAPSEFEQGHVSGALLMPLAELPRRIADIPDDVTGYGICASGNRRLRAAQALTAVGETAVSVAGGMSRWAAAQGRPPEPRAVWTAWSAAATGHSAELQTFSPTIERVTRP